MSAAIQTLVELGIANEEYARQLLEKNNGSIERAVEAFFEEQTKLQSPLSSTSQNDLGRGFWSRIGPVSTEPEETQLLEGISASLRELKGIPDQPTIKLALELDTNICDPEERLNNPSLPVGLVGLRNTTPFTCIIQALYHWKPIYDIIIDAAHNIVDWGAYTENFDPNIVIHLADMLRELLKVFAGLLLTKRSYRSCVSVTLSYLAYRNNFNLGLPSGLEETWAYFAHALSSELKGISQLTRLQISRLDNNGKVLSQHHLAGISILDHLDLHESISNLTLNNSSYLFSSSEDLKKGRLLSFVCSEPSGWRKGLPLFLYMDRYLFQNSKVVQPLLEEKKQLNIEGEALLAEVNSISQNDLPILKVAFLFSL
jgi:hypothetical protein